MGRGRGAQPSPAPATRRGIDGRPRPHRRLRQRPRRLRRVKCSTTSDASLGPSGAEEAAGIPRRRPATKQQRQCGSGLAPPPVARRGAPPRPRRTSRAASPTRTGPSSGGCSSCSSSAMGRSGGRPACALSVRPSTGEHYQPCYRKSLDPTDPVRW